MKPPARWWRDAIPPSGRDSSCPLTPGWPVRSFREFRDVRIDRGELRSPDRPGVSGPIAIPGRGRELEPTCTRERDDAHQEGGSPTGFSSRPSSRVSRWGGPGGRPGRMRGDRGAPIPPPSSPQDREAGLPRRRRHAGGPGDREGDRGQHVQVRDPLAPGPGSLHVGTGSRRPQDGGSQGPLGRARPRSRQRHEPDARGEGQGDRPDRRAQGDRGLGRLRQGARVPGRLRRGCRLRGRAPVAPQRSHRRLRTPRGGLGARPAAGPGRGLPARRVRVGGGAPALRRGRARRPRGACRRRCARSGRRGRR